MCISLSGCAVPFKQINIHICICWVYFLFRILSPGMFHCVAELTDLKVLKSAFRLSGSVNFTTKCTIPDNQNPQPQQWRNLKSCIFLCCLLYECSMFSVMNNVNKWVFMQVCCHTCTCMHTHTHIHTHMLTG
jgi:hypothetical protein